MNHQRPGGEIDCGCAMRIEHRPFFGARLALRNAVLAPRVGTDYDVRLVDLVRLARIGLLVFGIVEKIIQKAHRLRTWCGVYFFALCSASFINSSGSHLLTPFAVASFMPSDRSCQSSRVPSGPRSLS